MVVIVVGGGGALGVLLDSSAPQGSCPVTTSLLSLCPEVLRMVEMVRSPPPVGASVEVLADDIEDSGIV